MSIVENLQKILTSRYGKDVRQAIHDAIEDCYADGKAGATDLIARQSIATETTNRTSADTVLDGKIGALQTTLADAEDRGFYSKNLISTTFATTTKNGVTCTNNGDGTYTFNGTATATTMFGGAIGTFENGRTYRVVGCPSGGSNSKYWQQLTYQDSSGTWQTLGTEFGNGLSIVGVPYEIQFTMRIASGQTVSNLVFKPMLSTDTTITYADYTPYTHSTHELSVAHDDSVNRGFYSQNLLHTDIEYLKTQNVGLGWSWDGTKFSGSGLTVTPHYDSNNVLDGFVFNGTATSGISFRFTPYDVHFPSGVYKVSGEKSYYSSSKAMNLRIGQNGGSSYTYKGVTSGAFSLSYSDYCYCYVYTASGQTWSNELVKPMLTTNLDATYSDFTPYVPSNSVISDLLSSSSITSTNNGLTFVLSKWGKIGLLTCTSGSTTNSVSASGSVFNFPDGYKPLAQAESVDVVLSTRIIALSNGTAITNKAIASGSAVRFSLVYIIA